MKFFCQIGLLSLFLLLCSARVSTAADQQATGLEFFEKKIRPVLIERCDDCHSGDEPESELATDSLSGLLAGGTRGPAIVVGDPKKSLLINAISHGDLLQMPPKDKLPLRQIQDFKAWISMGAPWPNAQPLTKKSGKKAQIEFTDEQRNFWAFQQPVQSPLPKVKNENWVRNPIDRFILAKLEAEHMQPATEADKRTLIRRVTFDLTGLPPTPAEVAKFLADESSEAYRKLIDLLLASPRYGETWGRHWLDVARYADSNGLDENLAYINAFQYRDYVISAFNKDKPYDQFIREQIAGDLLAELAPPAERLDQIRATGFLCVGTKMLAEDDQVKMQMDIIDEQLDTLGRAFLGLSLGCARCHAHKFDPIPQEDYYSLAGILKSTKTMENFKVVANWQEVPLGTPEQIAELEKHKLLIAAKQAVINKFKKSENDQLQKDARAHVGNYLLAAKRGERLEELLKNTKTIDPKKSQLAGLVLREAEDFQRGNILVQKDSGYGTGIGVILNKGQLPNFTEYDFDVKTAGNYLLQTRYAAAGSRPVKLFINGEVVKPNAIGNVTGSWNPDTQTWAIEGVFKFKHGKNVMRFECPGPFPHIDKWLIYRADQSQQVEASSQTAKASVIDRNYKTHSQFVSQWVSFLKESRHNPNSVLTVWLTDQFSEANRPDRMKEHFAGVSLGNELELAARFQELFSSAEQAVQQQGGKPTPLADPVLEEFRKILHDAKGPFALPKSPESLYPELAKTNLKKYQAELKQLESTTPELPRAMAVSEGKIQNLRVHLRGSHVTLGEEVPRQFPRIISGDSQTPISMEESGRLQLANWLSSPDNPLASRVMVNRIWHWHFGNGIVRTPDNFGRLGERPSHPKLLDWLAVRFMEHGWSIKDLHRFILQSATYRMSTAHNAAYAELDPANKVYWRMNRRRMAAEEVRDSLLAISETIDFKMGGATLPVKRRAYVTMSSNVDPKVYKNKRRSVYLPVVRSAVYEVLTAFDFANPSMLNGKRQETTVASQSLFMMNSELMSEETGTLSKNLLENKQLNDPARISVVYQKAFSRQPTNSETDSALAYINSYADDLKTENKSTENKSNEEARQLAWQSFCRAVLSSNEFIYIE